MERGLGLECIPPDKKFVFVCEEFWVIENASARSDTIWCKFIVYSSSEMCLSENRTVATTLYESRPPCEVANLCLQIEGLNQPVKKYWTKT